MAKLTYKDLKKGRRVFLAEPGYSPLEVVVAGHYAEERTYMTVHTFPGNPSLEEMFCGLPFRAMNYEEIRKTAFGTRLAENGQLTENTTYKVIKHRYVERGVILQDVNRKMVHHVQDMYFDGNESNTRVFSNHRQADAWGDRNLYNPKLLTLYTQDDITDEEV